MRAVVTALKRFAEATAAALLAVIFVAFIIQIALRYLFNWPVGWTAELSVAAWLWLVLWGAAFVLQDHEEIRIDFLYANIGRRGRLIAGGLGSAAIIVLFAMSLPAAWSYVSFMKVEKTSYMNIRFDHLFSIYILFSVAVIARNLWNLWRIFTGHEIAATAEIDPASP